VAGTEAKGEASGTDEAKAEEGEDDEEDEYSHSSTQTATTAWTTHSIASRPRVPSRRDGRWEDMEERTERELSEGEARRETGVECGGKDLVWLGGVLCWLRVGLEP